jgi:hypothetical protein
MQAATKELPSILWDLKVHYHVHKSPILSQIKPVHSIPSHLSKIHFHLTSERSTENDEEDKTLYSTALSFSDHGSRDEPDFRYVRRYLKFVESSHTKYIDVNGLH